MLLLDDNLSWRLVRSLQTHFPGTIHVGNSGLIEPASDNAIWDFAKRYTLTIVTNDEDFLYLLMQKGFPPKVVLLKIGNASSNTIANVLIKHKKDIVEMIGSDQLGILEIY